MSGKAVVTSLALSPGVEALQAPARWPRRPWAAAVALSRSALAASHAASLDANVPTAPLSRVIMAVAAAALGTGAG